MGEFNMHNPNELLIKETNTLIRIDENNNVLLTYDVEDGIADASTEGILTKVCSELYDDIKKGLFIDPSEYGVEMMVEDDVVIVLKEEL
jgi:hypothetical protein